MTVVPVSSNSSGLPPVNAISSSTTRQIIFLNPTNQTPSAVPLPTKQSSQVLISPAPLVVVPGAETNLVSSTPNIVTRPNSEIGQPSVIMSLKLSDCSSVNS